MPYIGLTGNYRYDNFEFSGTLKYSGWVKASDNDEHYARDLTFRSKVKNQNYYSIAANAGYYVTPNAKVYVEGSWNRITNKKAILRFMTAAIIPLNTVKILQALKIITL